MDAPTIAALIAAGAAAGALNTLAGGGSLVLVPALMLAGLDATAANATSRIPIFTQCLSGAAAFAHGGRLPTAAARVVVGPVLVGAGAGAYVAAQLDPAVFRPMLLGTLVLMALALVISPGRMAPPPDATPRDPRGLGATLGLVAAGFYGGVLQAGAGMVFLAIFAGGLRYDLVRANALKALVMLIYIALTAAVFIYFDLVYWGPGLVMAIGSTVGAWIAARVAMTSRGVAVTKLVVVVAVIVMIARVLLR